MSNGVSQRSFHRKLRLELIKAHESKRPLDEEESMADVRAIQEAKETLGTFQFKTDPTNKPVEVFVLCSPLLIKIEGVDGFDPKERVRDFGDRWMCSSNEIRSQQKVREIETKKTIAFKRASNFAKRSERNSGTIIIAKYSGTSNLRMLGLCTDTAIDEDVPFEISDEMESGTEKRMLAFKANSLLKEAKFFMENNVIPIKSDQSSNDPEHCKVQSLSFSQSLSNLTDR